MPTIDQLAPATSASDTDEFIVSQGGIARKITRSQVLNGVQPQLSVPSGTLLGGTPGGLGTISIGSNLVLAGGTLAATATPFSAAALPAGKVPQSNDLIAMAQGGANVAVTYQQFLGGMTAGANLDVSQATIRLSGSSTAQALASVVGNLMPLSGGSMAGALTLAGAPLAAADAANKGYVDSRVATALPLSGGTLSGTLLLSAPPALAAAAANKGYVDAAVSSALPTAGGSMTGALVLAGDPATALQAATRQYADQKVGRAGDTLTGALTLAGLPTAPLHAATKAYVDSGVTAAVPLAGGTMTGALYLASDPVSGGQAATKQYADQRVRRSGDTLSGVLTLAADPVGTLDAATKGYVDAGVARSVPLSGGSMAGALLLATDPDQPMQAATRQYADLKLWRNGDTMTGMLTLSGVPFAPMHAATKSYVDAAVATGAFQAGGSFIGAVYLAGDPVQPLQAATREYVDARVTRSGDTLTGMLSLASDPSLPLHAATKHYVDAVATAALPVTGGSLSGALYLASNPSSSTQAATKQYVDQQLGTALPLSGGTLGGSLTLSGAPQLPMHAATRQYVDTQIGGTLPQAGGTLTGPLILAGAPNGPLQAATKAYVDANPNAQHVINVCLPPYSAALDGKTDDTAAFKAAYVAAPAGSVIYVPNGTTVLQQPGNWGVALTKRVRWVVDGTVLADGTPLGDAIPSGTGPAPFVLPGFVGGNASASLTTSQGSSQPSDFAVQHSSYIVNHTGGTSSVIANSRADTIIYNSPANFVWNGLDRLVWAGAQTPSGSGVAQHVGRYVQTVRETAATNSSGQALPQPQLWAACLEYHDATGQPSSVTGASLTVEMDWFGNGKDDANVRTIQSLVVGQANTAGDPVEVGTIVGIWLAGGSTGSAQKIFSINIPFSSAVLDTTYAQSVNNAPVLRMTAGQAIAFEATNSNRLLYDSATNTLRWFQGSLSYPVGKGLSVGWVNVYSSSATLPNYISGNMIVLSGSSPFTITLPAASTVAAGTGFTFSVAATAPVTIATTGTDTIELGPITLRTYDRYHIVSDGSSSWREVFRTNSVSPTFRGPVTLPSYTVATLPAGVVAGAKAFASNGRKPSEGAGSGSGVEVFFDGQHWISSCSGAQVAA